LKILFTTGHYISSFFSLFVFSFFSFIIKK